MAAPVPNYFRGFDFDDKDGWRDRDVSRFWTVLAHWLRSGRNYEIASFQRLSYVQRISIDNLFHLMHTNRLVDLTVRVLNSSDRASFEVSQIFLFCEANSFILMLRGDLILSRDCVEYT
jgi:hypothetical protein